MLPVLVCNELKLVPKGRTLGAKLATPLMRSDEKPIGLPAPAKALPVESLPDMNAA